MIGYQSVEFRSTVHGQVGGSVVRGIRLQGTSAKQMPMWLELEGLRVVHACWDDRQIAVIRSGIEQHSGVTSEFLHRASTKDSPLHLAIEDVLKGAEARPTLTS